MAANLHISISAEPIFDIGGFVITNSMFTSVLVSTLLITFALIVRSNLKDTTKPQGIQNVAEWIIEAIYGLIKSVTGDDKRTRFFFPMISTFLVWILFNNWIGLFPGVGTIGVIEGKDEIMKEATEEHSGLSFLQAQAATEASPDSLAAETTEHSVEGAGTAHNTEDDHGDEAHAEDEHHGPTFVPILRPGSADLNTTLALGIISVLATQYIGISFLGLNYFKKFINFSSPIDFFVGILETVSEFAKIISFAFRLFGNIFAGEVLLVVISFLVPVIVPMPFYGLEIFVGFIQALVFSMLTLVFFNMATHSHDGH